MGKNACNNLVCKHTTTRHTTYASTLTAKEVFLSKEALSGGFESRIELANNLNCQSFQRDWDFEARLNFPVSVSSQVILGPNVNAP